MFSLCTCGFLPKVNEHKHKLEIHERSQRFSNGIIWCEPSSSPSNSPLCLSLYPPTPSQDLKMEVFHPHVRADSHISHRPHEPLKASRCVFEELKRKICFSNESEAGPIIHSINDMRWISFFCYFYVLFLVVFFILFGFSKCEYSTYMWNKRMLLWCSKLLKKGQLQLS